MEGASFFKIAFNTHHIFHPGSDDPKKYQNWSKTGILTFALATIFTAGIASLVILGTAFAKYNRIKKLDKDSEKASKVDNLAAKHGLKISSNNGASKMQSMDHQQNSGSVQKEVAASKETAEGKKEVIKDETTKQLIPLDKEALSQQFLDSNIDKNALFLTSCQSQGQDAVLELLYEMRLSNDQLPESAKAYIVELKPNDLIGSFDALPNQNWEQVKFLRVQGPFLEAEDKSIPLALLKDIFENCEKLEHLTLDNCGLDNDVRLVEVANLLKGVGEKKEADAKEGKQVSYLKTLSLTNNNIKDMWLNEEDEKSLPPLLGVSKLLVAVSYHSYLKVIDFSQNQLNYIIFGYHNWMHSALVNRELRVIGNPALGHTSSYQFANVDFVKDVVGPLAKLPATFIKDETSRAIFGRKIFVAKDNLVSLDANKCIGVTPESLKALFSIRSAIKTCKIQDSGINDETLIACIYAWTPEKIKEIREINFDQNQITDEGAKALAKFFAENPDAFPKLFNLSLKSNHLTIEGERALRDAVKGRDKLTLKL